MGLITKFKQYFDLEDDPYVDEEDRTKYEPPVRKKKQNVVSLGSVQQNSKVILREPKHFDDVQGIADQLINRRAVAMNLQRMPDNEAARVLDFVSGTVYAIGGEMQKLGPRTFLCTPDNIDVSGVISDMADDANR